MLALPAEYELPPAAEGHLRDFTPYLAVHYATILRNRTWTAQHQLIVALMQPPEALDRSKMAKVARRVIEEWMAVRLGYESECLTSSPITANLGRRGFNACSSNTQLCGQASDEMRVKLSDGGCTNGEGPYLRRCIDEPIPVACLVKSKRCGKSKIQRSRPW